MTELPTADPPSIRRPLPVWVPASTFATGVFLLALMATGGAIAPWSFGFGGILLMVILLPAALRALPRAIRFDEERLGWVLVVGCLFLCAVALQLVPLPAGMLDQLSPPAAEIRRDLGLWDGQSPVPLSLAPGLTAQTLTIWLVGYFVLCVTILTVRQHHLKWFAGLIAVGTGLWACYGLVMHVGYSESAAFKPFGVPHLPGRVTGPSVNPNRFAYLLEMGLPFCLIFLKGELQRIHFAGPAKFRIKLHSVLTNRRIMLAGSFWLVTSLLVVVALVLTRSRGGIAATVAALVLGATGLKLSLGDASLKSRLLNWRVGFSTLVLIAVVLFCLGLGLDQISERFGDLFTEKTPRWQAWQAMLPMVGDFVWTGAGAGTFRDVFSVYQPPELFGHYRFAHNEYLNLAIDMGLVGLLLGLLFMGLWFRGAWRNFTQANSDSGRWRWCVVVGVLAVAFHQVGDFGLQDPAVLWYFCLLLGLGLCPSGLSSRVSRARTVGGGESREFAEPTANGSAPNPVAAAVAMNATRGQPVRVRIMQGALILCSVAAAAALMANGPLAWADWNRPGTLWVHIDGVKGGAHSNWNDAALMDWQSGWEAALAITPEEPLANYQAAQAAYFRLRRELADQPLLAPGVQEADGTIRLTRKQSPLELSEDQRARIALAAKRVDVAMAASPARPEYHLLRLRLAVLADDLPTVLAELPRVRSLYRGVPAVLQELAEDLVYAYQRSAVGLSEPEFLALRRELLQQLLARPEVFEQAAAFALSRGITLKELTALAPGDPEGILRLGLFLQKIGWHAKAASFYLQVAQMPSPTPAEIITTHRAWMHYLEICIRMQQLHEIQVRLPEVLAKLEGWEFDRLTLLRNYILPTLEDPGLQEFDLEILRDLFRGLPAFPNPVVEAARLNVVGRIAFRLEDWEDAKAALGAARKLSPNPTTLLWLGMLADREADYTTAARYYSDMLRLGPANRVQILRRLARSYTLGGQKTNAAEIYNQLMDIDPDHRSEYAAHVGSLKAAPAGLPRR